MTEIEYVHLQFFDGVTPPTSASYQGGDRSIILDAVPQGVRRMRIVRDGDAVIATCSKTGRVREYPWQTVRQALRADVRHVERDPRLDLLPAHRAKALS